MFKSRNQEPWFWFSWFCPETEIKHHKTWNYLTSPTPAQSLLAPPGSNQEQEVMSTQSVGPNVLNFGRSAMKLISSNLIYLSKVTLLLCSERLDC